MDVHCAVLSGRVLVKTTGKGVGIRSSILYMFALCLVKDFKCPHPNSPNCKKKVNNKGEVTLFT